MASTLPMNDPGEQDALLRLLATGGPTEPRRRRLEAHGSATAALGAGAANWRACGLDQAQMRAFGSGPADRRSLDWLAAPDHHLLGWSDPDYPALLRTVPSPPLALFVAGNPALCWHPSVAVVGSRSPSAGGRDNAAAFSRAFARSGLSVVSGLALGIDAAAHQGALDAGGVTVAVLGCGIDRPYPARNRGLCLQIAGAGAVVSEYPPGTVARAGQFPARNRIVAGLALGTLVVEAAMRSGALITARLAADAGREVFAVPGSIHNPMARGCHRLIRSGAGLVESADEVIQALAPLAAHLGTALRKRLDAPIEAPVTVVGSPVSRAQAPDPDFENLWGALVHDPTDMDLLVERTGLTAARLSSMLPAMELEGRVVAAHGRYSRKS